MLRVINLTDGLPIFKALDSEIRIQILSILMNDSETNLDGIAKKLNLSNGSLSLHIKKLIDAELIEVNPNASGKGNDKIYRVKYDRILTEFHTDMNTGNLYESEINPGLYSDFTVYPSCGVATKEHIIGDFDDPRYFSSPEHASADLVYFSKGYVEYILPFIIPSKQRIDQISISAELCSEAPGSNDVYPSDIHFSLNGIPLGFWTSPGDFGKARGRYNPSWWSRTSNQYGLLKTIVINHIGTFIDAVPASDVTIDSLKLSNVTPLKFRISVPNDAVHVGGVTIFGRGFGNFDQGIVVQIKYSPVESLMVDNDVVI